ncbi:hypothetical protein JG687_00017333 [Phytophthora cactorum]|uniref:DDE-1 domain-containing protein n=1 Tax=Phytophthora cactorum TaxID=29920 RepID=A0A8T1TSB2_9STRA|nr:hypothetical protein JG687_00017333 [Phytophthora cactorum]
MDRCSSHYSRSTVELATELQVVLVCLPANATHLFQPLEVAVFASFKGRLRVLVNEFVDEDDHRGYSIDKSMVKGKKRKTANVSGQILTAEMMKKMEQKEHKKTKKTTVKTDTDMKKTGAAKSTKGAKLVDPTNTAAAVNTTKKF